MAKGGCEKIERIEALKDKSVEKLWELLVLPVHSPQSPMLWCRFQQGATVSTHGEGLNLSQVLEQSALKMGEELPEATLSEKETQPCPLW